jgi:hypothetical protein
MAVPSVITDLSATAASNSPAGGDAVFPDLDNYLRAHASLIRYGDSKAANISSAATTDIGAAAGRVVDVTGTATITSLGTVSEGVWRIVRFTGACTLTHNATSLILPGGANITAAAGDCAIAVSLGSGNWVVTHYQRASVMARFAAERSGAQSITNGSYTTIIFDTATVDVGSGYNAANGLFTAPVAGIYQFTANVTLVGPASFSAVFRWTRTGVTFASYVRSPTTGASQAESLSLLASLAAGDAVAFQILPDNGGGGTSAVSTGYVHGFRLA